MAPALDLFSPAAREWFRAVFAAPTEVQERGWRAVASGSHTLMTAPTGSGKTLAAFLWCLDRVASEPPPPAAERCRVLYGSPLKAPAGDVERHPRAPLGGPGRAVEIVDAGRRKTMDVRIEVPVEDMSDLDRGAPPPEPASGPAAAWAGELPQPRRSIWPAIYPRLLELILAHRSTIVFVNSRRLAERLAARLNELAPSGGADADGEGAGG